MRCDGTEPVLSPGVEVVLREAAFGYEAGARGVVIWSAGKRVQVQFKATGHTVPVPAGLLAAV